MGILAQDVFGGSGDLDGNWTTVAGFVTPQQVSGVCQPVTNFGVGSISLYTAVAFPNDQYVSAKLVNVSAAGSPAIVLRGITGARTCYQLDISGPLGASVVITIRKYVGGTPTTITTLSTAIAANDIMKFTAVGTTLTGYINDVQVISGTDATHTSGSPGLVAYITSLPLTNCQLDDFEAGDFSSVITGLGRQHMGFIYG